MKRQLLLSTAVGLILASRAALAADMPAKAPPQLAPAQYYSWSGFYVGAHAGYGWSADPGVTCVQEPGAQTPCMSPAGFSGSTFLGAPDVNAKGFLAGLQLGYNWQSSNWLFGIETDFSGTNIHDSSQFASQDPNYANAELASRYNWLGTTRGRAGFVMDRTLVYATGGFAYARVSNSYSDSPHGTQTASGVKGGWTVGGGLEYALSPNWTVKGEYLYVNLQNTDLNAVWTGTGGTSSAIFHFKNDLNIVRLGVNYRF
jgi:outer membrane immunogenic protein